MKIFISIFLILFFISTNSQQNKIVRQVKIVFDGGKRKKNHDGFKKIETSIQGNKTFIICEGSGKDPYVIDYYGLDYLEELDRKLNYQELENELLSNIKANMVIEKRDTISDGDNQYERYYNLEAIDKWNLEFYFLATKLIK